MSVFHLIWGFFTVKKICILEMRSNKSDTKFCRFPELFKTQSKKRDGGVFLLIVYLLFFFFLTNLLIWYFYCDNAGTLES